MIVVAIIGILASLAVSAYQTYTVRAQVSEALSFAGGAKVPVVDAFTNDGRPPADRQAAGMSPNPGDTQGSYVSAVTITDGRIDIQFGNDAHQAIFGTTLSVTPYIPSTGGATVNWRCGYAPAAAGTQLMQGGGSTAVYQSGNIESRYLPASCRP
ncbi:MAG: pilin [Woeseiaceae bacterium]|nr:pilin [Woeseiaceae bacterium]